jgi:DNA-binding GntR family transcriptional regulator
MPIPKSQQRVDRSLLRDDVYLRLRDAIVGGTLAPGESLRDGELAEWLGVSRTPVREALLRLAGSGLIVARPGRSTSVAEMDEDDVRHARDVVASMHELATRVAVPDLPRSVVEEMRETNRRFAEAVASGDPESAITADEAFHGALVRASGNPAIAAVLDQFEPVVRRAEFLRFVSIDRFASVERHATLISLCEAGDAEGAAALAFDTWHGLPVAVPGEPVE